MSKEMCTYRMSSTKTLQFRCSLIRIGEMKKFVFVLNAMELIGQVMNGKRVEGVLYVDQQTGRLTFKAYNRQPRMRQKDVLVKKLPWGWVKESLERIKVFGSFPKDMGTAQVMGLVDETARDAKNVLIDRELDLIEFC